MVTLSGISKRFPGFTLGPVDLAVPENSFFMLMGPTGSGKTLILETIAGLCSPDHGRVFVDGKDVTKVKTGRRGVGIVYQDSALFPHLTVQENIEYGLKWSEGDRNSPRELTDMLDLGEILHRFPGKLSGGEKQRTALARALVTGPAVILLDEPMSSLDPHFRGNLRSELREIHSSTGTTFIMATHDFSDALSMGTAGAVVNCGRIEQQGGIDEIFFKPQTPFMASFVGMKNIIPVEYHDNTAVTENGMEIFLNRLIPPGRGHIAVSPDSIVLSTETRKGLTSERNHFQGRVTGISRDGYGFLVDAVCSSTDFTIMVTPAALEELRIREGMEVWLSWKASAVHVY